MLEYQLSPHKATYKVAHCCAVFLSWATNYLQRHIPVYRCARVEVDAVLSENDDVDFVIDDVYDD